MLARSAADVKHESALGKGFRSPCRGRSLGRPALSEPIKLPSERPASRAGCSPASGPPPAARLSPHLALFLRQLRPFHQGCSSKCTKARGGCKRRRELSWRQLEQRAGRHDSRASASAPTAAADGRKVLRDNGGATGVAQTAVRVLRTEIWQRWEQLAPPLTQISAAPQTMTPVLQDKPRHSTDLAELCSLILWSALFPFRS